MLGEIADNVINGSLFDTLVPKNEENDDVLVIKLPFWKKEVKIGDNLG